MKKILPACALLFTSTLFSIAGKLRVESLDSQ